MVTERKDSLEPVLNGVLRLLAIQVTEGKSLTEKVQLLERAGLDRNLIADMCETTPGSVRAILSQAKKGKKTKAKKVAG